LELIVNQARHYLQHYFKEVERKKSDILLLLSSKSSKNSWKIAIGMAEMRPVQETKNACFWFLFSGRFVCELQSAGKDVLHTGNCKGWLPAPSL
jgi:hypothetical protein